MRRAVRKGGRCFIMRNVKVRGLGLLCYEENARCIVLSILFRKNENYIEPPPQNMLNKKSFLFVFLLPTRRPKSGSMLLYSRKKVRYRRDGYCWKKRKDGKTTREDHMKLKVQGTEVSRNRHKWKILSEIFITINFILNCFSSLYARCVYFVP